MSYDLSRFGLREMLGCGLGLRRAAADAATMEEAAQRICRYLYEELRAPDTHRHQCVLVRCYKTHPFGGLEPELQGYVRRRMPGEEPDADMKCLTLLATAGEEPAWNDRRASRGHRAIPLPTPQIVEQAPMIAQLIRQFGLDLAEVVRPSREVTRDLLGKTYGIFHVEDARGSPYIPAQDEFVEPYGVRAVIGFGGSLRTGDLYATILFSRVAVPPTSAERFRTLALDVKGLLFTYDDEHVFAPVGSLTGSADAR